MFLSSGCQVLGGVQSYINYAERKHVASYVILAPLPPNEQPLHVCFNIAAIGSRPPSPAIAANDFPASDQTLFATSLRKVVSSIYWYGETAVPVNLWLLLAALRPTIHRATCRSALDEKVIAADAINRIVYPAITYEKRN